jgi:hypothetical protein
MQYGASVNHHIEITQKLVHMYNLQENSEMYLNQSEYLYVVMYPACVWSLVMYSPSVHIGWTEACVCIGIIECGILMSLYAVSIVTSTSNILILSHPLVYVKTNQ